MTDCTLFSEMFWFYRLSLLSLAKEKRKKREHYIDYVFLVLVIGSVGCRKP